MGALEKIISQLLLYFWWYDFDGRYPRGWFLGPSKYLAKSYILDKLLLAKKLPKLGIQIPNAGDDNQSCLIWTVIFNQINWIRVPRYTIYSFTLFYTNVSISTFLWWCAPRWIWYDAEILKKTCYHVHRFICRFLVL